MTDKREQFETIKAKYYAGRSGRALDVRDDYIAILEQAARAAPAHPDCFNCGHAAHSGDCVNVAPARPAVEPIHWEPSIEDDK